MFNIEVRAQNELQFDTLNITKASGSTNFKQIYSLIVDTAIRSHIGSFNKYSDSLYRIPNSLNKNFLTNLFSKVQSLGCMQFKSKTPCSPIEIYVLYFSDSISALKALNVANKNKIYFEDETILPITFDAEQHRNILIYISYLKCKDVEYKYIINQLIINYKTAEW